MRDIATITDTIRQSVSALDAGRALGLNPDRNGRCACPVHMGKNNNCRLDSGDRGFHCFKCGAGGDVIALVRAVHGCTFQDALRWLDGAFHLGLPLDRQTDKSASETAEIARKLKQSEREQNKAIDRMLFDCYVMAGQLADGLEEDAKRYRPVRPYAPWDKKFCDAMRALPEARDTMERMTDLVMEGREQ